MSDTATTLERISTGPGEPARAPRRPARRPRRGGADRLSVALFSLAAFLVVLTLLAGQLRLAGGSRAGHMIVVRKVYVTRVVETVVGVRGGGTSVSRSQSTSGSASSAYSVPRTRTS
jgi:hypothetical protein